jgi:hypothetical protein
MSRLFRRNQDEDEFTEEEINAAELIVESSGKKVVSAEVPKGNYCFLCGKYSESGNPETFMTNTSHYSLFVCADCRTTYKAK